MKVFRKVVLILLIISILWFGLYLYEKYRVSKNQKPLICFNNQKVIESDTEYSKGCIGILYHYKEYYDRSTDEFKLRKISFILREIER